MKSKITFQTILQLCEKKGWTTLEEKYINANFTMRWKCNTCGYIWKSNYNNTRKREKCSRCQNGGAQYFIDEVKKITLEKGFKLIDNYISANIPVMWECITCKYKWKTCFSYIIRKKGQKGCPKCRGIVRYKYEDVIRIAKEKNLTCLDSDYKNCNIHMKWSCDICMRIWKTSFRSIIQNIGCIKCTFDKNMKLDMNDITETIKNRNIECLDIKYVNKFTKMNWKCLICNNIWQSAYNHIKYSKSGCPNCTAYRSQKTCRKIFEKIMGNFFPTVRPKFLEGLEYDGYNADLKLAFEYQGIQHYKFIPYFHKNLSQFEKLLENDIKKRKLSVINGITLIEIPYQYTFKNVDILEQFILKRLEETGFIIYLTNFEIEI